MTAVGTVADATPPQGYAAMSDAEMVDWLAWIEVAAGLDPRSLRAVGNVAHTNGGGLWHAAGQLGCTDVCEYLKSKGLLDLMDQKADDGWTPLHHTIVHKQEEAARWMVSNGADIDAINDTNETVFRLICMYLSPSFIEELADKVAPDHLTMWCYNGWTPMQTAFIHNPEPLPIVRMLIIRGVPSTKNDFYGSWKVPARHSELLASLEADLNLNDRTFLGLFLAAGVHAPYTTPACTTTMTTVNTKRVRTQRPDGRWSDPITVPCEPHLVVTAAPTIRRSQRVAARVETHLPKLRGFGNTKVRMEIAEFLGVRSALELRRLRAARDVLVALPEKSE